MGGVAIVAPITPLTHQAASPKALGIDMGRSCPARTTYVHKGAGSPSTAGWTGRPAGRCPGARSPRRTGTRRWHRSCCRRRCRRCTRSAEASGQGSAALHRGNVAEGWGCWSAAPAVGVEPGAGGSSKRPHGSPLTLDTDAELAAGSVVSLVVGGVADHMLSFREFGAGLRAPQHHPAPNRRVSPSAPRAAAPSTASSPRWQGLQHLCPHLLMTPSAESLTRGGSQ